MPHLATGLTLTLNPPPPFRLQHNRILKLDRASSPKPHQPAHQLHHNRLELQQRERLPGAHAQPGRERLDGKRVLRGGRQAVVAVRVEGHGISTPDGRV